LAVVATAVAVHRCYTGEQPWPPVLRLGGGVAVRAAFARTVRRQRPPPAWWRSDPHGWSFPSRHTTHALLASALLTEEIPGLAPRTRASLVVATTAVVGASRLRLGVHWPSDVLAGVVTGALWLNLTQPGAGPRSRIAPRAARTAG
jgi:undecaprenyl-diphosphatase